MTPSVVIGLGVGFASGFLVGSAIMSGYIGRRDERRDTLLYERGRVDGAKDRLYGSMTCGCSEVVE